MSGNTYREVFEKAFWPSAKAQPYAYQCRLAGGQAADPEGGLLERHGAFRLAFFEAVFRAAAIRALILAKISDGGNLHA